MRNELLYISPTYETKTKYKINIKFFLRTTYSKYINFEGVKKNLSTIKTTMLYVFL